MVKYIREVACFYAVRGENPYESMNYRNFLYFFIIDRFGKASKRLFYDGLENVLEYVRRKKYLKGRAQIGINWRTHDYIEKLNVKISFL